MVGRTAGLALVLMLVQNSGFVLVMRYSRHQQQGKNAVQYNPAVVVVMQELFKLGFCFVATTLQQSAGAAVSTLGQYREALRVFVPAACFTLQNNLLYVALSNLEPLVFQITYQIKTLLTALLSVRLLGRSFSRWQWISQARDVHGMCMACAWRVRVHVRVHVHGICMAYETGVSPKPKPAGHSMHMCTR